MDTISFTQPYDIIIAGGGAAGLSLAYRLTNSPLHDRRILVVDRDAKKENDRTWCFWATDPTLFSSIYHRSWDHLRFVGDGFAQVFDLGAYRYNMIRGIDFYRFIRRELKALPTVGLLQGNVDAIAGGPDGAQVVVDGRPYRAQWVFDSRFDPAGVGAHPHRYHYLKQHFKGWIIDTPRPVFDPTVPTLFDFRTPQRGVMRFIYILPFTPTRALVEYTLFSADLLPDQEYDAALCDYITRVLGVDKYEIVEEEAGIIPMTDQPFPRRLGHRVMAIGSKGGRVKPSTGYAFRRIQQDSAAIVRSLSHHGHPFAVPADSPRYHLFDSILLQILYRRGHLAKPLFTDLFRNNPISRIFRFLDEEGSLLDNNLQLLASLPAGPFLRALFRLKVLRTV